MCSYTLMTPGGFVAGTIDAPSSEVAAQEAEARGYTVVDVMDDVLVIPHE